ncbi:MAG: hypothetical protein RL434_3078 [Pseudomonadota bacterium]
MRTMHSHPTLEDSLLQWRVLYTNSRKVCATSGRKQFGRASRTPFMRDAPANFGGNWQKCELGHIHRAPGLFWHHVVPVFPSSRTPLPVKIPDKVRSFSQGFVKFPDRVKARRPLTFPGGCRAPQQVPDARFKHRRLLVAKRSQDKSLPHTITRFVCCQLSSIKEFS